MRVILMMAMAAMMAFTLNAADLVGTWKGSMETQGGPTDVTITIQPGATVSGKVTAGGYEGAIEHGKSEGDKISFVVKIDPGTVAYEGSVAGNEMRLNVTGTQGHKYTLICKRQR